MFFFLDNGNLGSFILYSGFYVGALFNMRILIKNIFSFHTKWRNERPAADQKRKWPLNARRSVKGTLSRQPVEVDNPHDGIHRSQRLSHKATVRHRKHSRPPLFSI